MSGYLYSMKNVKIKGIFYFVLLFYMVLPFDMLANGGNCPPVYQEVYSPSSMSTSDGFFNPKIRICGAWAQCNDCTDYSPGQCGYVWPSKVFAFALWQDPDLPDCPEDCLSNGCHGCSPKEPLLCACTTFACSLPWDPAEWAMSCMADLGCIKLPLAPGPPPFCPVLGGSDKVETVPVVFQSESSPDDPQKQSFFNPKIRAIIASGRQTTQRTFDVLFDSSDEGTRQTVPLNGTNYVFATAKGGTNLACLNYYGTGEALVTSDCRPTPPPAKPIVTKITNDPNQIPPRMHVKFPGCSGHSFCESEPPYDQEIIKDSGLKVIQAKIADDHFLAANEICVDGSTPSAGKCADGTSSMTQYQTDSNSTVSCLVGYSSEPGEYLFQADTKQQRWIKSLGKKLVHYAVIKQDRLPILCSDNFARDLSVISQDKLDKIEDYSGGYYKFSDESKPIIENTPNPCNDSLGVYMYGNSEEMTDKTDLCIDRIEQEYNGTKHYFCATQYYDEDTKEFFFPPRSPELKSRDPHLSGLCVDNFERTSYIDTTQNLFFTIDDSNKRCDFLAIEAWGGGASGSVTDANSGASGDFVSGVIKIDHNSQPKDVLKISIGKGGGKDGIGAEDKNLLGEDSIVELCKQKNTGNNGATNDSEVTDCQKLLIAGGGGQNKQTYFEAVLQKDRVLQGRFNKGKPAKDADKKGEDDKAFVPYHNSESTGGYVPVESCKIDNNLEIPGADNNLSPGAGGCINKEKKSRQFGADGKVTVTCEIWSR